MIAILNHLEVDTEISSASCKLQNLMVAKGHQKITEVLMRYWLQDEREQDFTTKMDGSLSTYLLGQLVDCVG